MIGKSILHFQVLEELGRGGMGIVYRAQDTRLNRLVALKFLPQQLSATEEERARFIQEAQSAAALNHPNICTIYGIHEASTQPLGGAPAGREQFIEMELVDGVTLREKLRQGGVTKLDDALSYGIQIGEALQEAHSRGIVHRDVKSENIMLNTRRQIKVMDFGLAKLKGAMKLTRASSTVGTLAYMAPEQIQGGEVDAQSDIFSFGVVLYEMVTGRIPFSGEHDAALMYSILNEDPIPVERYLPDAPEDLRRILRRALEKDPEDRYQSAADMVSELRRMRKQSSRVSRQALDTTAVVQRPAELSLPDAQDRTTMQSTSAGTPHGRYRFLSGRKGMVVTGISIVSLLVLIAVILLFVRNGAAGAADSKSVVVLPFKNLSGEKDAEYFSDGITEDITTHLSKISDIRVISPISAKRYKNSDKSLQDIARELGVGSVLEGSVRQAGGQVRIVAQLIDAASGEERWADTYDRDMAQVFSIQSEIAQRIAAALQARLSIAEKSDLEKKPTGNVDAYTLYLRGREYYYRYHKEDNESAIQLFKRAIDIDPHYALAFSGLADAYGQRVQRFGFAGAWADSAIAESHEALAIDSSLAEAYKSLALAYTVKGWLQKSLTANLKAVELNPRYYPAVGNLGIAYYFLGNCDEAVSWGKRAIGINPAFPYSYAQLGLVYGSMGDDSAAQRWLSKSLELQPDFVLGRSHAAQFYVEAGRLPEAEREAKRIVVGGSEDPEVLTSIANVDLLLGRLEEARGLYEKAVAVSSVDRSPTTRLAYIYWKSNAMEKAHALLNRSLQRDLDALAGGDETSLVRFDLAEISAVQGNVEEACKWLQKAIDAGWVDYRLPVKDPLFANLQSDHRFKEILAVLQQNVQTMRARMPSSGPTQPS